MKKDLIVAIDDVSVLELHLQPSRRRSSVVKDTKSTSSRFLRLTHSFRYLCLFSFLCFSALPSHRVLPLLSALRSDVLSVSPCQSVCKVKPYFRKAVALINEEYFALTEIEKIQGCDYLLQFDYHNRVQWQTCLHQAISEYHRERNNSAKLEAIKTMIVEVRAWLARGCFILAGRDLEGWCVSLACVYHSHVCISSKGAL